MSMWEPFTEPARNAMVLAEKFATEVGNRSIGSLHIFVGIVDAGGDAAEELRLRGASAGRVREVAESLVQSGGAPKSQEMTFDSNAKRVIELAFEQARDLNQSYLSTEHLMLGYLRECRLRSDLLAKLQIDPVTFQATILDRAKSAPQRRPATRGKMTASLEELFDRFGGTSIPPDTLWSRLRGAAENEDAVAALCYAFSIALRSGWTWRDAAEKIEQFLEENSG